LVSPGARQAWPIVAACWSPARPQIGIEPPNRLVVPKRPAQSTISGSASRGAPNRSTSPSLQAPLPRPISRVREALVASVTWAPSVRFHTSQLSTVPIASRSPAARSWGQFSIAQPILVPLK
jgi:hypothetical protein